MPSIRSFRILRIGKAGQRRTRTERVTVEEPLELRLRGKGFAITMRTPGHDEELAAGLLLAERIVQGPSDIVKLAHCARGTHRTNTLNIFLTAGAAVRGARLSRGWLVTASCGLCGKETIEAVHQHFPPITSSLEVSANVLKTLPDRLRTGQKDFALTGGLHGAALLDARGRLLVVREDVGRHNAVDKVIGHALLQGWLPCAEHILAVSGRASFEIVQKALAARIPLIAAISAPSSLAVEFAQASGQTLVAFFRDGAFNVYSGPQRTAAARQLRQGRGHAGSRPPEQEIDGRKPRTILGSAKTRTDHDPH